MAKKIPLFSLVLLIVASIDSIRNLPASALFGSALIFFFLFSAIVFLIPTSLVAAELSSLFPTKGGIYHWVQSAFGEKMAMLAIWLQWINTMVWYPTILSFIAGTAAFVLDPALANSKAYLVVAILVVFWGLTLINLRGLHLSTKINNYCAVIGMVLPMAFLIVLGGIWALSGRQLQIDVNSHTFFPSLAASENWVALIAIMSSFVGVELAGVHVNDINNPQRNFPRAIFFSGIFILATMVLGSLAIAFVIPNQEINLVAGVIQVFTDMFDAFGLKPLAPVLAVLIVVGAIGGMTNWLISPAKGLLHAAEFGYLPRFFMRKNAHGVPAAILISQAVLVSLLCVVLLLVPSVNGFYWFLTALSTELYMIMYLLMFFAAVRLHYKFTDRSASFKIPGDGWGMWTTCALGVFGASATIIVSFLPPPNVDVGTPLRYILMIAIGNVATILPVLLFYFYRRSRKKLI